MVLFSHIIVMVSLIMAYCHGRHKSVLKTLIVHIKSCLDIPVFDRHYRFHFTKEIRKPNIIFPM